MSVKYLIYRKLKFSGFTKQDFSGFSYRVNLLGKG